MPIAVDAQLVTPSPPEQLSLKVEQVIEGGELDQVTLLPAIPARNRH
jgi:hypothetical protein